MDNSKIGRFNYAIAFEFMPEHEVRATVTDSGRVNACMHGYM